ncbi:hypothetical protein OC844_004098 [Tilletia horrida]|nr:hypothetical protein OC844_004098 [Tilletia horrida]
MPTLFQGQENRSAQFFERFSTDAETGKPGQTILSNIFEDVVGLHLAELLPAVCKDVPRVRLDSNRSYIGCGEDNVWLVDVEDPTMSVPCHAVLKTARIPPDAQDVGLYVSSAMSALQEARPSSGWTSSASDACSPESCIVESPSPGSSTSPIRRST